ncbi:MAG: SDR family oxidoreductase [Gammaproteobacteria bacterium]|nr:SDR family oxidoreductase [Gammaproteobacteria bacterium]
MIKKSKGKVAIITGGTKGIGEGIAQKLADDGVTVVVTSRNAAHAQQTAYEINARGGQALGLPFNVEQADDLKALIEGTVADFGRLDILVNNSLSQSALVPLETLSDEQVSFAFTSNISHTFLLTRYAYPHLKKSKGCVVNIGSAVVNNYLLGLQLYAVIKGAVVQMTKVFAAEWAADGVRVNAINPGIIRTSAFSDMGMPEDVIEQNYEFYKRYHPLGRVGDPAEIGAMVAYLVSADAAFITGSIIEVDGGCSVQGQPMYGA